MALGKMALGKMALGKMALVKLSCNPLHAIGYYHLPLN